MQSQEDIVRYIAARDEFLDFTGEVLKPYLDYEHARPFLKDGTTSEQWEECRHKDTSDAAIMKELTDYMAFAWGKVEDHRGLSASRSVDKCTAWAWLLVGDDIVKQVEEAGYAQYGAPRLAVICQRFGLPIPIGDDVQRMMRGDPCGAEKCGCGED